MALLTDQVCVVSGAGQGLGRAVALEMASEGAAVVLLERNADTVASVASEISGSGGRAEPYELDVTDYDAYGSVIADVLGKFGKIDALINNAAINPIAKTILEDDLDDWRRTIAINLEAVYMGSKLIAPDMATRKDGRIVNIASIQGFAASGGVGSYNAAKGGMIALTKSMAVELGPYNILVNAVAPGFMSTPMSIVDGVNETETPRIPRMVCEQRQGTPPPDRLPGRRFRHGYLSRLEILPIHDGTTARRRWRLDEHVLKRENSTM